MYHHIYIYGCSSKMKLVDADLLFRLLGTVKFYRGLDTRLNNFGFGRKIPPTMHIRRPIEKIIDIL